MAIAAMTLGTSASLALGSGGLPTGGGGGERDEAFPVRAKHTYGDGLGAGRGHQGQDILAGCRKRIVAARPGRVVYVDYQASGAGNYAVIKGKKFDYVYMHMLKKPSVRKGQRVAAGEQIGLVGSTGRSTACHLHFEMWKKPGWFQGGDLTNPTPFLRRWDK